MQLKIPGALAALDDSDRQLVAGFAAYLLNGVEQPLRPDTIRTYLGQLSTFVQIQTAPLDGGVAQLVNRPNLLRVLTGIEQRRASARRNMLFALKAFARYLRDMGMLEEGPYQAIASIKFKSKHKPERARISAEDAAIVMRHIAESPSYDEHERVLNLALIATMAFTGLRNTEACRLQLQDVDFEAGVIRVTDGKGGKAREVGLPERIVPLLRYYLANRGCPAAETFFVGPSGRPLDRDLVGKRMARLSRATGIKIGAHMLRRRFATRAAHLGVPLDKLQVVMGHADIQTTRGYVQTVEHEVAQEMRHW